MSAPIAITGGTLFDGTGAPSVPAATVLIDGSRIVAAGRGADIGIPDGATEIDASGRTVLPGLIDMHIHSRNCRTESFPLFLALGVTTVRDCASVISEILPLRESVRSGAIAGPRIYSMGGTLDGSPPTWALPPGQLFELHDEAEAAAAAAELIELGVDGLKLYARLSPSLAGAVLEVARGRVPVTGHLSRTTASEAVELGITCLEHVHASLYQDVVKPDDRHPPDGGNGIMPNYWSWLARGWARADLDADHVRRFIDLLVERDVSLCSTEVMITGGMLTDEAAEEPGLALLPAHMRERHNPDTARAFWADRRRAGAEAGQPFELDPVEAREARAKQLEFIKRASEAGVRLVIGTDVGGATMQVPGFSMHREMALHQEAGLTPAEILHAATGAAATALWKDDEIGTVEAGKLADLVIVEGDPLKNLAAARDVVTVIRNGEPLDAAVLLEQAQRIATG